ncbi:MAG: ABC transporter permease [Thermoanaerobaculia bacterium]
MTTRETAELARLAWGAVNAHRLRSVLTVLGIVIGIASVTMLTSLGEGTRRYIVEEFTQFGTHIMSINKGKATTSGIPGVSPTVRKLTIEDAEALKRVPGIELVLPGAYGTAAVEAGGRSRRVLVAGVTGDMPRVFRFGVRQGRFLPDTDPRRGSPLAVLGPRLSRELFGEANPLGERVRIGGRRFLVIGVMEAKGQILGFDMDDRAYIPVASAQSLFNQEELSEIHAVFSRDIPAGRIKDAVRRALIARHDGEEDFTVTTETEMLDVLGRVLSVVSLAVAGIGAISLLVGAMGILTMMWIGVGERTGEIGLLRALGATRRQILVVFLIEAVVLSTAGGAARNLTGWGLGWHIRAVLPGVPFGATQTYALAALVTSLLVGAASGVLPARRAASLDPLEALRAE